MNCEIITVGTEILLGDIVNTHAQYLSRELSRFGLNVLYHVSVGDNPQRLEKVFTQAMGRSDFIVLTGGLGPTKDDLTKEIVCNNLQIGLQYNQEVYDKIIAFFVKRNYKCPENNKKQAMVPEGAVLFDSDWGTAPGMAIEKNGRVVVLLPGPPSELIPMVEQRLVPYLEQRTHDTILSHNLCVFGIGESAVQEKLGDMTEQSNPTVALYAKTGEVRIRVTAKAENQKKAEDMIAEVIKDIQSLIGKYIYGIDVSSLEEVVVTSLVAQNLKIATAESCTGGLLVSKLVNVPGASRVLDYAVVTYSNAVKTRELGVPKQMLEEHGAVSEQVAIAMANGVRKHSGASIGVGITGIAGPDGGSLEKPVGTVFVAIASEEHIWVKQLSLGTGRPADRDTIRYLSVLHALNMVYTYLNKKSNIKGLVSNERES